MPKNGFFVRMKNPGAMAGELLRRGYMILSPKSLKYACAVVTITRLTSGSNNLSLVLFPMRR
jgi:hypothetical protein